MRSLVKNQIKELKSAYMELDKDILCEIFAMVIYRLSNNGISIQIPILTQSKIENLIENGFLELVDEISKEPMAGKIKIDYSKHDEDILLEFMRKFMSFKENED